MDNLSIKNILKFISITEIALSIFFLIPVAVGYIYHENANDFLFFDMACLSISTILFLMLRKHKVDLTIKEGILSVNLVWILLGFMGALPLVMYTKIDLSSGFFEAISGFTTTGATVYSNIEALPKMVLMLRSLTHWLGGMGIIVLGVGLFSLINPSGSLALFKAESTGISTEKLTPKIKDTALRLWGVYAFITLLDTVALHLEGMSFFDAVNHAFATISTGGFSTKNASLGYFNSNSMIIWTTTFFMLISGINFLAHLRFFYNDISGYESEEVVWYIKIFLILSIALSLVHYYSSTDSLYFSLTHGFFTISSILTTTGFVTLNYEHWGQFAVVIVFVAMLIGGNTGSTAGGMKVVRYVILFKSLGVEIKKILHPNAMFNLFLNGSKIKENVLGATVGFLMLFILSNAVLTFYLFARGYDALTAVSAAVSCVGNIGPGFGHVGPVDNYGFFSWYDKIVLAIFMIIGRLEFYTVALLFTRSFWKKF